MNKQNLGWLWVGMVWVFWGCSEATSPEPVTDADSLSIDQAQIERLFGDLGRLDRPSKPGLTKDRPLLAARTAAMGQLNAMGPGVLPAIRSRLQIIPTQEAVLLTQTQSSEVKAQLLHLSIQKQDLITLLGGLGSTSDATLLLELANTSLGQGLTSYVGLVTALRNLGAELQLDQLLNQKFADLSSYPKGGASVLEALTYQRRPQDAGIAQRVSQAPIELNLRGRAILLGVRLGLAEEMLPAIDEMLRWPQINKNELTLTLRALGEVLEPSKYAGRLLLTTLDTGLGRRKMLEEALVYNKFWWSTPQDKERQLMHMLQLGDANRRLAVHFMLGNDRLDLLRRFGLLFEPQPGSSDLAATPQLMHMATVLGFRFVGLSGRMQIENIAGVGLYQ